MKKQLIAFFTAGAIATTGMSDPVQAGDADKFARLLLGAVIIGAIAESANGHSRVVVTQGGHQRHGYNNRNHINPRHVRPQPPRHQHAARAAQPPRACLIQTRTNRGWNHSYKPRCMQRNGWHRHSGLGWHRANHR